MRLVAFLLIGSVAFTTDFTWTGSVSDVWNVDGNWDHTNFPNSSSDTATLNLVGATISLGTTSNITINTLTLNPSSGGYYIGNTTSQNLQMQTSGSNATVTVSNASSNTISATLNLANNTTFSFSSGGTLTLEQFTGNNHGITLAGTGTLLFDNGGTLASLSGADAASHFNVTFGKTLIIGNNSSTTFSGSSNCGLFFKIGTGTLTMNGSTVTFNNGCEIAGGTLALGASTNLNSFYLIVDSGHTFNLGGGNATFSFGGNVGSGNINIGGGNLTWNTGSFVSYGGAMTGAGTFSYIGGGTTSFSLSGNNSYSANTFIQNGILAAGGTNKLSPNSNITLSTNGQLDLQGFSNTVASIAGASGTTVTLGSGGQLVIGGTATTFAGLITGAGGVTMAGTGTFVPSGTNDYTNGTTFQSGTLSITALANIGNTSGTLTFNGGTLDVGTSLLAFTAPTVLSGTGTLSLPSSGTASWAGAITGSGGWTIAGGGTLTVSGSASNSGSTTISGSNTLRALAANAFSSNSSHVVNGKLDLNGFSESIRTLSGAGSVTLSGGTLTIVGTPSTNFSGNISGSGVLIMAGSGTFTLSGNNTYHGGQTIFQSGAIAISDSTNLGTDSLSFRGGILNVTSGTFTLSMDSQIIAGDTANIQIDSDTTTLSGQITESGSSGSLNKTGAGTLIVSGTNSYTGSTTITGGTFQAGGADKLSSSSPFHVLTGATFSIDTFSNTIASLAGSGSAVLGSGATLTTGDSTNTAFDGIISGAGNLTKVGTGTFTLGGINTFTGSTTISAGKIVLGMTGYLGSCSTISVASGAEFDVSGYGGSPSTAIVKDLTGLGTVTLGAIHLEAGNTVSATTPSFGGVIQGSAGVIWEGIGTWTLNGPNTYTGSTTISAGTVALGNLGTIDTSSDVIVDGALDISGASSSKTISNFSGSGTVALGSNILIVDNSVSTTFSGNFTSTTGGLTKQGSGGLNLTGGGTIFSTAVFAGTLSVNGTLTGDILVSAGALQGGGELTGNINILAGGVLAPGNSIGTITQIGTATISGTYSDEVSPTAASLLTVTGPVFIDSGATLKIVPDAPIGAYSSSHTYTLIHASSGVTGTFTNLISPLSGSLSYPGHDVVFNLHASVIILPTFEGGNAAAVAETLNAIADSGNTSFDPVFEALSPLNTDQIIEALNIMNPALFTMAAITQQHSAFRVIDPPLQRFQYILDTIHCASSDEEECCKQEVKPFHIWVNGFADWMKQGSVTFYKNPLNGFRNNLGGVAIGSDYHFHDLFYTGLLGAYTNDSITWQQNQGNGKINTGYFGLYFAAIGDTFYGNLSLLGGWSHYKERRHIVFPGVYEIANNSHWGRQFLAHLDAGINIGTQMFTFRPFDTFDWIIQNEQSFTEHGAGLYNMHVKKTHYNMFRNELGLDFASCYCNSWSKWSADAKVSWIREMRMNQKKIGTAFAGDTAFPFTVIGFLPTRSLLGLGFSLSSVLCNDRINTTLFYEGEFGPSYQDNSITADITCGF